MRVKLPVSVSRIAKALAVVAGGVLAPVAGHAANFDLIGGKFIPEKGDGLERIVTQIDKEYGVKTTVDALVEASSATIKEPNKIREGRSYDLPEGLGAKIMAAELAKIDAARRAQREKDAATAPAPVEKIETVAAVAPATDPSKTPEPVTSPVLSFGDSVPVVQNGRTPSFDANDYVVTASVPAGTDAGRVLKILSEKPSSTPGMCVVEVEQPCAVTEQEEPVENVVRPKPRPVVEEPVLYQPYKMEYTVQRNEDLCGISDMLKRSFTGIVEVNGIKDPNKIAKGQELSLDGVGWLDKKNDKGYKDYCTGSGPLPKPVRHDPVVTSVPPAAVVHTPTTTFKPRGRIKPEQCTVEQTASGKFVFKPLSNKFAECGCSDDTYYITLYDANGHAYKKRVQGASRTSALCHEGGDRPEISTPPEPSTPPTGGCDPCGPDPDDGIDPPATGGGGNHTPGPNGGRPDETADTPDAPSDTDDGAPSPSDGLDGPGTGAGNAPGRGADAKESALRVPASAPAPAAFA